LCLHVTGKRHDGQHLLESLVVFPDIGDRLEIRAARRHGLKVTGPFGLNLSSGDDNLVTRAARLMNAGAFTIELEKNLPVAAGIGGGSADAAATIRGIVSLTGVPVPPIADLAMLGADIPVCMASKPAIMRGVGDEVTPAPKLPSVWTLLVNAGQTVATGAVFAALKKVDNAPMNTPVWNAALPDSLFDYLRVQRNDLQTAACAVCPIIADVLGEIAALPECQLARMSGSGGTCFGLFSNQNAAEKAARILCGRFPDWWVTVAAV